jgi:hypothetical protein
LREVQVGWSDQVAKRDSIDFSVGGVPPLNQVLSVSTLEIECVVAVAAVKNVPMTIVEMLFYGNFDELSNHPA